MGVLLVISEGPRGTLVTESLGRPSMMSLSLLSLINFALAFFEALLAKDCSVMGELDLELALSKEEGEEDDILVVGNVADSPVLD